MSKEKRREIRKKRKRFRLSFIIFIFVYLMLRSVPTLYASTLKTTLAEEGSLEDKIQLDGIVIKNEKVYNAEGEGKVSFSKDEGDRIGVGSKVGQLSLLGDNSTLKGELDDINHKIEILEDLDENKDVLENDKEKNKENMDEIVEKLQKEVFDGDYKKANLLKDELQLYAGKQKVLDGDYTLLAQSLDNLKKRKEELLKEISEHVINYYSKESGILTFTIDGLEEVFSANNISNYSVEDFKNIEQNIKKVRSGDILKPGDPAYKIIDNFEWYLMVKITNVEDLKSLKEGSNVLVYIDDSEENIKGNLIKIDRDKNNAIGIIKLNSLFHNYYDKRYVKVDLVKNRYEGLKIPTKTICQKNGINGVYIKDISNVVKFRPVKILGSDEKCTVVEEGDKNHLIKLEKGDKPKKTITVHDEILLNTNRVKEGQIVN